MKNQITVPVSVLKILKSIQDTKSVRPQVRSIHISSKGYLAATDGASCFISHNMKLCSNKKDYMIEFPWISFSGVDHAIICFDTNTISYYNKMEVQVSQTSFMIQNYPIVNFRAFIDMHKPSTDGITTIDVKYMKYFSNFEKGEEVNLYVGADNTPSIIYGMKTGAFVVMPKLRNNPSMPEHLEIR